MDVFLFFAAAIGGALNSVAGGGSFLTLPALIYSGVSPVVANATSTLAMWPGSLASAVAYRREVRVARRWLMALGPASLVGGLIGGELLVKTSDTRFLRLLPWLMLAAVLTFTFGGRIAARLRGSRAVAEVSRPAPSAPPSALRTPVWLLLFQLLLAIYGGYFGGGMGIMMLAAFAVVGMTDIHEMNAVKAMLAVAINGVALASFVVNGTIAWRVGLVMVAGSMIGGYLGASMARRISGKVVRVIVVMVGWGMTAYFFWR